MNPPLAPPQTTTSEPGNPTTPPTTLPKRPTSEARRQASMTNGRRGKGPTSEAGKARSRLNGLKHGLRSELPVLPGEDADALQQRLDLRVDELQPQTDVERYLIANAVHASWRLDRCRRAEAAALSPRRAQSTPMNADETGRREVESGGEVGIKKGGGGALMLVSTLLAVVYLCSLGARESISASSALPLTADVIQGVCRLSQSDPGSGGGPGGISGADDEADRTCNGLGCLRPARDVRDGLAGRLARRAR